MAGAELFDRIAGSYDLLNTVMTFGLHHRWRAQLARRVEAHVASRPARSGRRVLDLATGTGDVVLALVARIPGLLAVGIDVSEGMLEVGRAKVARKGFSEWVKLQRGDAQELEFSDGTFDVATMSFGIRNVPDRARALREILRVLRPGGAVFIIEIGPPGATSWNPLSGLARWHLRMVVPFLGALVGARDEYAYLGSSSASFPLPSEFATELQAAGFSGVSTQRLHPGGVHLYFGVR